MSGVPDRLPPELEIDNLDEIIYETWIRAQSLSEFLRHFANKDELYDYTAFAASVPGFVAMVAHWADQADRLIREATA